MAMFESATKCVTKSIGSKTLHHVPDLNSSERYKLLCVVFQKKSFWPWKGPQINPTQIVLDDLLTNKLNLDKSDIKFTLVSDYIENPTLSIKGDIGAKIASELQLDFSADDLVNLSINMGSIQKQEITWQKLNNALQFTKVNMLHPLIEEVEKQKRTELCIVLESISTCSNSTLSGISDVNVSTEDSLAVKSVVTVDIHTKDSIEKKITHSYTLPPDTVLAFSCNSFSITEDGTLDLHAATDDTDFSTEPFLLTNQAVSTVDAVDAVKSEFELFIKSSRFAQVQQFFKSTIGSIDNSSLEAVNLLLSAAEASSLNNAQQDNTLHLSLSESLSLWKPLLISLNFLIPGISEASDACIKFPPEDESRLIRGCIGLIDALHDIDESTRKYLAQVSEKHYTILQQVVESEILKKETIDETQLNVMFSENQSTKLFLSGLGFNLAVVDGKEHILYSSENRHKLLDAFVILYIFSAPVV